MPHETAIHQAPLKPCAHPLALVFAPYGPYPTQTGAHVGSLMVLEMLRRMGYHLVIGSSPYLTDVPWSAERISITGRDLQAVVELHEETVVDPIWRGIQTLRNRSFHPEVWVTPSLALWFEGLVEKYEPDLILINYAKWGLLAQTTLGRGTLKILQTHDLLSVNDVYQEALKPYFKTVPLDLQSVPAEVLREDFLDPFDRGAIPGLKEELSVLRGFDLNILVSRQEEDRIQREDPAIFTHHMPIVFEPRPVRNTYAQPPVFLAHTNNFNLQGCAYFVQRVLPNIRKRVPDFRLQLAGNACKSVLPVDGLELLGFVEDLDELYAQTRFAACPLLGGTGQQVKVMEAMSHGLPVVVVPRIAKATGIVDGVNGLVAPDAEAYAEACVRLWQDPELCRHLGGNARSYMLEQHSFDSAFEAFARDLRHAGAVRHQEAGS